MPTKIPWTNEVWNCVRGCSKVSAGCKNCYAEKMANRLSYPGGPYEGLAKDGKWTGKVRFVLEKLHKPLHWRKPRMVFVASMGDPFHEKLSDEEIGAMFAVMAACPQHRFQVLTKRPERMRDLLTREAFPGIVAKAADQIMVADEIAHMGPELQKPIPGYPGYYVTDRGRVLSAKRGEFEALRPDEGEQGHRRVQLHRQDAGRYGDRFLVHHLVLEAFVGPSPHGASQTCHRDGNPRNNALPNLRWGSQSDNWSDRKRHGHGRSYAKLDRRRVRQIRRDYRNGWSRTELATRFGVSETQITNIVTNAQWKERADWPLPQVWLGVTTENQEMADERIPLLLECPAAVRFVSIEPMLGPVDLERIRFASTGHQHDALRGGTWTDDYGFVNHSDFPATLDWIIAGCEKIGNRLGRPMDLDWVRDLRDQCKDCDTAPFFLKQAADGKRVVECPELDGRRWAEFPR